MSEGLSRRSLLANTAAAASVGWSIPLWAAAKSPVAPQPFFASVKRAMAALSAIGQPISGDDAAHLNMLIGRGDADAVIAADAILSKYTVANVALQADGYSQTSLGEAPKRLVEQGWTAFLVRVGNPSGITATLNVSGQDATTSSYSTGASRAGVPDTINPAPTIAKTWYRNELYQSPPIASTLSGAEVEYQIIQIYSRDRGRREMRLDFWTTKDMAPEWVISQRYQFASIQFDCATSADIPLRILDADGRGCMASLTIRDKLSRVYPLQAMRLAPDMFFHPQIYRADGETVRLPDGEYTVVSRRGPEYLTGRQTVKVAGGIGDIRVQLERWIDPSKWGWYSGDTHIHGGGCAHYEHPTEGVTPETMIRHVRGEGLSIGDVLSWGPSWYYQKQFFTGHTISPAAGLEHPDLQAANNATWTPKPTSEDGESILRYDVEVSGFPSSHCGHLVLLRLKEQDYPGTTLIQDWPSWNLPILKWAKAQGAAVGYAHCGNGMEVASRELPNYEIPPMDNNGTQEAIVDITHGFTDFLSGVDTVPNAELNAWYHMLNCGFRLALIGETDYPCFTGERVGYGRSYVRLTERPTSDAGYQDWINGLLAGHLYCGDGRSHFLDWSIDGHRSGEKDVILSGPSTVTVKTLVAARLEIEPQNIHAHPFEEGGASPEMGWHLEKARIAQSREVAVELIVNGQPVERQVLLADGHPRDLRFTAKVEHSSWIALRILPSAHTYPIFVVVGGKPIRASKLSAQWCRQCVDKLWEVKSPMIRESERASAAEAYNHARQIYDQIIVESDQA